MFSPVDHIVRLHACICYADLLYDHLKEPLINSFSLRLDCAACCSRTFKCGYNITQYCAAMTAYKTNTLCCCAHACRTACGIIALMRAAILTAILAAATYVLQSREEQAIYSIRALKQDLLSACIQ
eukprot:15877-Heterococcus_DN1.PRE.2